MTLGAGVSMSMSKAHKINTKRSTEAEPVGVYDALPDILWGKYFLEAQGYKVEHNVLLQDNKSTILLATNGMMSSLKKTKHIRHRFFLIKDRVESGDVEIAYEPTCSMWSDILTKPKQGSFFRKFSGHLRNVPTDYDDEAEHLRTHPLLLTKEDDSKGLSTADKNIIKKTTNNISFAPDVKFTQRTLLRPNVPRINKEHNTRQESMQQQVTNTVAPLLTHHISVLGDQLSRSPQYRRYLEMKRRGQTERSCSIPPIPTKGT